MADFQVAYNKTAAAEGGYANNPKDRGGETWRGIARNSWPKWEGWQVIDDARRTTGFPAILALNANLAELVVAFYKREFWDVLGLDGVVSQDIAEELYDTAVNIGHSFAAKSLQRVLNVANKEGAYYADLAVDGHIGAATIRAVNKHPRPMVIVKGLNCLQGARYLEICEANPSQEVFFNGWIESRIFQ